MFVYFVCGDGFTDVYMLKLFLLYTFYFIVFPLYSIKIVKTRRRRRSGKRRGKEE